MNQFNHNAIANISLHEKKNLVRNIFIVSKKIKFANIMNANEFPKFDENGEKIEFESRPTTFELIISLLPKRDVFILEKEFSSNDPLWYRDYCSKSTYYKDLNAALDRFIHFLYE
ncbi:MG284/MPN403 family protein [Mycoplasma procyoni]|uniref:MG284/MPN403 family protein n=1 Tax=Mycoplasma procyoni TaxID=568784 RepID=UPI00197CA0AA|nr:hypothetical protein [Mycoplasma procyoni]MBN3535080.1 hypothetical protein [Mycoplasma procyoni]